MAEKVELGEIRFTEPVQACGCSESYMVSGKYGLSLWLVGSNVAVERENYPPVIVFPSVIKTAVVKSSEVKPSKGDLEVDVGKRQQLERARVAVKKAIAEKAPAKKKKVTKKASKVRVSKR